MVSTNSDIALTKNILISLSRKSVCASRMKDITSRNEGLTKKHGPVDGIITVTGIS